MPANNYSRRKSDNLFFRYKPVPKNNGPDFKLFPKQNVFNISFLYLQQCYKTEKVQLLWEMFFLFKKIFY